MDFHTATIVDEEGIMLIFGGRGNSNGIVYKLNLTEMDWSSIDNISFKASTELFIYLSTKF